MRIQACLKCGSLRLDFTPGNGLSAMTRFGVGPVAGIAVCMDCGNMSPPIEFDDEKNYTAFLAHLKKRKANKRNYKKGEPRK